MHMRPEACGGSWVPAAVGHSGTQKPEHFLPPPLPLAFGLLLNETILGVGGVWLGNAMGQVATLGHSDVTPSPVHWEPSTSAWDTALACIGKPRSELKQTYFSVNLSNWSNIKNTKDIPLAMVGLPRSLRRLQCISVCRVRLHQWIPKHLVLLLPSGTAQLSPVGANGGIHFIWEEIKGYIQLFGTVAGRGSAHCLYFQVFISNGALSSIPSPASQTRTETPFGGSWFIYIC